MTEFNYLLPDADDADGNWTNELDTNLLLYQSVDELVTDDADYVKSEADPAADIVRFRLSNPTYTVAPPATMAIRFKRSGTGVIDLTVRVLEGTTPIVEYVYTDIADTFVDIEETLTSGEYASITDFNNLFVEIQADQSVSGAAYVFRGSFFDNPPATSISSSIDIGTASADRLVIVGCCDQNAHALTSVVVNGVTLNIDIDNTAGGGAAIASGLVPSGSGSQTVTVTWAGSGFEERFFTVWTATGLSSNVVKHTAAGIDPISIAVDAGDFLFSLSMAFSGAYDWDASTQAPTRTASIAGAGSGFFQYNADWLIAATNPAFSIDESAGAIQTTAASYA